MEEDKGEGGQQSAYGREIKGLSELDQNPINFNLLLLSLQYIIHYKHICRAGKEEMQGAPYLKGGGLQKDAKEIEII